MHLRSGVRSLPRTPLGELTALPQTPNWFLRSHPCSWLLASNYGHRPGVPPARPIPGYAHGADDKTRLELKRKVYKITHCSCSHQTYQYSHWVHRRANLLEYSDLINDIGTDPHRMLYTATDCKQFTVATCTYAENRTRMPLSKPQIETSIILSSQVKLPLIKSKWQSHEFYKYLKNKSVKIVISHHIIS